MQLLTGNAVHTVYMNTINRQTDRQADRQAGRQACVCVCGQEARVAVRTGMDKYEDRTGINKQMYKQTKKAVKRHVMQSGQAWTNTKSGRYVPCATAALTCTAANGGMYENK